MPDPITIIRLANCPFCETSLRVHPPAKAGKVLINCACGEIYSIDFFPKTIFQQRGVRKRDDFDERKECFCFHLFLRHDWSTKKCEVEGCRCEGFKSIE